MKKYVFILATFVCLSCDSDSFPGNTINNTTFDSAHSLYAGELSSVSDSKTKETVHFLINPGSEGVSVFEVINNIDDQAVEIKIFDSERRPFEGLFTIQWNQNKGTVKALFKNETYYMTISNLLPSAEGLSFFVQFDLDRSDLLEFNNSTEDASKIESGREYYANFEPAGDVDFFTIDHDGSDLTLDISFKNILIFELFDENGSQISEGRLNEGDLTGRRQNMAIELKNLAAGSYVLKLSNTHLDIPTEGSYTFNLN